MIDLRNDQKVFVEEAYKHFNKDILTRGEINSFVKKSGLKNPSWLKTKITIIDQVLILVYY